MPAGVFFFTTCLRLAIMPVGACPLTPQGQSLCQHELVFCGHEDDVAIEPEAQHLLLGSFSFPI